MRCSKGAFQIIGGADFPPIIGGEEGSPIMTDNAQGSGGREASNHKGYSPLSVAGIDTDNGR